MDRRAFMALGMGAAMTRPASLLAAPVAMLRATAQSKGVRFGCAVNSWDLWANKPYAALVAKEAAVVVPEGELKRIIVQKVPGAYDFSGADHIWDFAQQNGMAMRGHCFAWYDGNPPWMKAGLMSPGPMTIKRKLLTDYIQTAMAHYKGRIKEWDVVNEPADPDSGRPDGMRANNPWSQALGEQYMDIAFETARAADPTVKLYLNDFGIEADTNWSERKRTALLKLLDRLKGRGVPIDGFGVQGHLMPYQYRFDQNVFAAFLAKLSGYGLKIAITEMDFRDRGGATDPRTRDADMAAAARAFLDVALDNPATTEVLSWGLSDKYSWLQSKWNGERWPDGQLTRGLPFDADMQPKPLFSAIQGAFAAARAR